MPRRFITVLLLLCLVSPFSWARNREFSYPETWMQFTPAVFDLGAVEFGLHCDKSFGERAVTAALAYSAQSIICFMLKSMVPELRPDGSRYNSFPSAHTAAAFVGAELIRGDYGDGVGSAFYACGVYVGAMRVQHLRHWWWDTVAGAAIGVSSVFIARALYAPVRDLLDGCSLRLIPVCEPLSGTLCASLALRF